ncbi:MAG: FHA domain-containing protein [Planctomycetes bacterium]|nr:FHA domain-containing protein [Planctomycetota bacterium]
MIKLTIIVGQSQTEFELDQFPISFGRTPDNTIQLAEPNGSRNHCRIEKTQQGYKLIDLESKNGTKLNGKFVNQALLKSGDDIGIGATRIIFTETAPQTTQAPKPAVRPAASAPKPTVPRTAAGAPPRPAGGNRPPARTAGTAARRRPQETDENGERVPFRPKQPSSNPYIIPVIVGIAIIVVVGIIIGASSGSGRSSVKQVGEKDDYEEALTDMKAGNYDTAINRLKNVKADSSKYADALAKIQECEKKIADLKLAECEKSWLDAVDFIQLYPTTSDSQKIRIFKKHLQKYPDSPHKAEAVAKLAELGASPD